MIIYTMLVPKMVKTISQILIACIMLVSCDLAAVQQQTITPDLALAMSTETEAAPTATYQQATVTREVFLPAVNTPTAENTIRLISEYKGPEGRITIDMPEGGRYVVVGDSLNFGSTFQGTTTYVDMCVNRYPYSEQLFIETGILSTSSLDRGESMKTPFYQSGGNAYCLPAPGVPTTNTVVPGSNTEEWINEHLANPVLVSALKDSNNRVALLWIIADLFSEKIGKPVVDPAKYESNIGKIIQQIASYQKVVYLSPIPYVTTGSFIKASELETINAQIDTWNMVIRKMISQNGYTDENGAFVDFGVLEIQQDNATIWVKTVQKGPDFDTVYKNLLAPYHAKDGLHYSKEGYIVMGQAWAEALRSPVAATQIKE